MPESRHLGRGREAYENGDWATAYEAFEQAGAELPLAAADLESWASTAFLLGKDDEFVKLLDLAHQRHLDHGDTLNAARCASWLAMNLAAAGAQAPAAGWLARTRRLLKGVSSDSAESGYLALAESMAAAARGDLAEVVARAEQAVTSGSRFRDHDLESLALHVLGRAELRRSRVDEGLALLDEAMAVLASRVTTPFVIGVVYCSVIDACRAVFSLQRAHEWTEALGRWCENQPDLVAFYGDCCVARAEMLVLRGAWLDAADEARRATFRLAQWAAPRIAAAAKYQLAEVHRLRGDAEAAERAYADVAHQGGVPYPGLALLRLQMGDADAAYQGLLGRLAETRDPLRRARLLPAVVESGLAVLRSEIDTEREEILAELQTAAAELTSVADAYRSPALRAMADHAEGDVLKARGETAQAAAALRAAVDGWTDLGAPYQVAKARVSLGRAYLAKGDVEDAEIELAAARSVFAELGAKPDLAALDEVAGTGPNVSGLSPREREVLAPLARGDSNKAIAAALGISERTVERHVSNIFDKLGVTSRTEAAAHALRNRLV